MDIPDTSGLYLYRVFPFFPILPIPHDFIWYRLFPFFPFSRYLTTLSGIGYIPFPHFFPIPHDSVWYRGIYLFSLLPILFQIKMYREIPFFGHSRYINIIFYCSRYSENIILATSKIYPLGSLI